MSDEGGLSRQSFFFLAKMAGLDTSDPHMEQLYGYLNEMLPKLKGTDAPPPAADAAGGKDLHTFIVRYMPDLKPLSDLDLTGLDPEMIFRPLPGRNHE
jgi:hypothetical protein